MAENLLDQARRARKPAADIDGGEFVRTAANLGLPTDNATLNRIVRLVNKGMTVHQAAVEVRRMKLVEGQSPGYQSA